MTDKEKLQKVLELLTDKNVGELTKKEKLNDDESFGALMFAGYAFNRAYKIISNKKRHKIPAYAYPRVKTSPYNRIRGV